VPLGVPGIGAEILFCGFAVKKIGADSPVRPNIINLRLRMMVSGCIYICLSTAIYEELL
jgi:hypothetical protein